jgi:hypothetical protein
MKMKDIEKRAQEIIAKYGDLTTGEEGADTGFQVAF